MQTIDLHQAIGNLVTHLDGRPRVECMEYRAINCASPEVAYAGLGDGPYVPGYSPLGKTVWCIRIDGHDAIARLRTLRQELRPIVESADNDDSVRFIADELAYRIPFLPVTRDETVNRGPIVHVRDPDTGELRPICEYVRADYLEALKGALSRFPAADPADAIPEYRPRKSDDAYCVIQFLHQQRAFDKSSLCRTEDIAAGMTGRSNDQNSYKHAVAKLSSKGIVQTATGRRGGVWLTDKGEHLAADIFST